MKTIKQLLITLAVLLCSATASAYDFEVDGIYYKVLSFSDLTVEVTKGDNEYSGEVIIPSTVSYKSKTLTVTSIGESAFENCDALTSVTIGNSVTSIGESAFYRCRSLTSVTIPNSVTSIGELTFSSCSGLTSIEIPNSVTSIESYAFYGCSGLTSIEIPNRVTSIGESAFSGCSGLTSIEIPNSVTTIGEGTFRGCSGLTSVTIGNSVTSIESYAFYGCSGLTSVTIGNSVTSIGGRAFWGCTSLKDLRIEDGETTLSFGYNSLNEGEFYYCPLESLYLGRNLNYNTWSYVCSPFYNKKTLKSVTIGNSVTSIGKYAFCACDSLASIRLLGETPPTVGSDNFTNKQYMNMIVYVPKGTLATYQAADTWKNFWDIREESTTETPEEEVKKCATPVIAYNDNGLDITSETDGAEIHTKITCSDVGSYNDSRIDLSATYSITTYATKSGYLNSETATATLCWIAVNGSSEENGIIEVEAMPVLITCNNGTINISGGKDGAEVVIYTTSGVAVGNATITNGNATISTELAMGEIAVVNIAGKGIKIVMQ